MHKALLFLLTISLAAFTAQAQSEKSNRWGSGIDFTKKAENREKGRWSLTEWLEMKNRNHMMDMWLSLNSPSPFEFALGGYYKSHKTTVDSAEPVSFKSYAGEFSAYAQLVGITVEYENNTEESFNDMAGMLNLRLLGDSIQNTSFTISYGQRTRQISGSPTVRMDQQFAQGALQLYLTKYFGLNGNYRYFLPTSNDVLGQVEENLTEAGLFIDFKALRVFGEWFKDHQQTKLPPAVSPTIKDREGIKSGIKIFF
ncbi:MAG: hypothetical protein ACXVCP_10355 [Bdellovibrio sp.]